MIRSVDEDKAYDEIAAKRKILLEVIDNMPDDLLLGIIKYVDQNTHINTKMNKIHEVSLTDGNIFILACVITVSKIINIGISMLGQTKLEYYAYNAMVKMIQRFHHMSSRYFLDICYDNEKYNLIVANEWNQGSILKFLYRDIEANFKKNKHMKVFYSHGKNLNELTEATRATVLTTIYKIAPIMYEKEDDNITYSLC